MNKIMYRSIRQKKTKVISEPKKGAWIHIDEAELDDVLWISENCDLDLNIVKDVLDTHEVPRIETEDDRTYIFTRFATGSGPHTKTAPVLLITGGNHLISISTKSISSLDGFSTLVEKAVTTQKTKLLIQIMLLVTNDYTKRVQSITRSIRTMSDDLETFNNKEITQLVRFEAVFNDFLMTLQPTSSSLSKLLAGTYVTLYEEDKEFVEDLFIDTNQLIQTCQSSLKNIANVREAYSTIISNNLNRTMKFLTALTLILTVPTMVASFFGMNVPVPLQSHPLGFLLVILATLGVTGILLWVFYKMDVL